jgi:hypothetical protein
LKLKIRDLAFKTTGNYQYVDAVVNGKTGSRPIPLINSIPYVNAVRSSYETYSRSTGIEKAE